MFTSVFLLNIVYFSVCLTSNKLYWIDDQLADVSTRFYTSASWSVGELVRRRVDRNSIQGVMEHIKRILNSHNVKVAQKLFQTLGQIFAKPKDPVIQEQ